MEITQINFILGLSGSLLGIIGSVLGVINFIIARDKDRVKLKVFPSVIIHLQNNTNGQILDNIGEKVIDNKTKIVDRIGIEVINLSNFPVSIKDVGFISKKYRNAKLSFFDKVVDRGGTLPQRMEPRTAIRVYHPNPALFRDVDEIKGAYALTECGKEFLGDNKLLQKQMIRTKA